MRRPKVGILVVDKGNFFLSKEYAPNVGLILNHILHASLPCFMCCLEFFRNMCSVTESSDPVLANFDWYSLITSQGTEEYIDHVDSHLVHGVSSQWLTPEEIINLHTQREHNSIIQRRALLSIQRQINSDHIFIDLTDDFDAYIINLTDKDDVNAVISEPFVDNGGNEVTHD